MEPGAMATPHPSECCGTTTLDPDARSCLEGLLERQLRRALAATAVPSLVNAAAGDEADRAAAYEAWGAQLQQMARAASEASLLLEALTRLREQPIGFGRCERCGAPIPFARLLLLPATRVCTHCAH